MNSSELKHFIIAIIRWQELPLIVLIIIVQRLYFGNAMTDAKQYDIGLKNKLQKPFTLCAIMQRKLCAPQTRWHQLGINQLILSAELTVGSQLHLGECCYTHSKFGRISEFMQTTTVNCQLIVDKLRLMCGFIRFILSS